MLGKFLWIVVLVLAFEASPRASQAETEEGASIYGLLETGSFPEAEALALEKIGHADDYEEKRELLLALGRVCLGYESEGSARKCISEFKERVSVLKDRDLWSVTWNVYQRSADLHRSSGDFEEAVRDRRSLVDIAVRSDAQIRRALVSDAYLALGSDLVDADAIPTALDAFDQAAGHSGGLCDRAAIYQLSGGKLLAAHQYEAADSQLRRALDLLEERPVCSRTLLALVFRDLAQANVSLGRTERAAFFGRRADELTDDEDHAGSPSHESHCDDR